MENEVGQAGVQDPQKENFFGFNGGGRRWYRGKMEARSSASGLGRRTHFMRRMDRNRGEQALGEGDSGR